MRIISGKYKGRQIIRGPLGIRPTQDKVRKALFDILGDIEGNSFLELFSGTGAVGLEAASHGAIEVVFVEKDQKCSQVIEANLSLLGYLRYSVMALDSLIAIKELHKKNKQFDIIFLDPPYYKKEVPRNRSEISDCSGSMAGRENEPLTKKTLQMLSCYDILTENGFIIVQHFKKDNLPDALGDLALFRQSRYGDTLLSFYRKG